ncbi:MAG TPA: transglycosylase SLT domain-containing protein [Bryobacteraceae bacterium]|nr:transglycosylase SLT domain-containing protein [Bryobacteraceae bacterium]
MLRRFLVVLILLAPASRSAAAQPGASLGREYRASPTAARRDALVRLVAQHPDDSTGALALLTLGVTAVERGENEEGMRRLEGAGKRLPALADYVSYYAGLANLRQGQHEPAIKWFKAVLGADPVSPLAGGAALELAKAHLESSAPQEAVAVLTAQSARLPQPEGDMAMALALEAASRFADAAFYGQRVFYGYPVSKEAAQAEGLIARLRERLGADYPPPLPEAMLGRAQRWLDARQFARARKEYLSLARELGGVERELAQVRAEAARYLGGSAGPACSSLQALTPATPRADAERMYYLVRCVWTMTDPQAMADHVERLGRLHADSEWRLEALVWAGNFHLLRNEPAAYVPYYRACYESFPSAPRAEYCHWKVAWNAYIERRPQASALLAEHVRLFPRSEKMSAALYFLGRLEEGAGAREDARARYRQIRNAFPGSYYVALAEERLGAAPETRPAPLEFEARAADRPRIARARLLSAAGLADLAESELRFSARTDGTPHVLALELARLASSRAAPDVGLRHIKGVFPAYLSTPLGAAPIEFWRLAFPLPYMQSQQRYAKAQRLDPYLLAGLIRQESEFNPRAVSTAGARGLMQILPGTGRQLGRTLKAGNVGATSLFIPDLNIRLGTHYLRSLINDLQGSVEMGLAAYNGGKTRTDLWATWAEFREPAEFVETIPITETRNYVQAVLRNAWMYRRIYEVRTSPASPKATTVR